MTKLPRVFDPADELPNDFGTTVEVGFVVVPLDEFVGTDEEGAAAVLGTTADALIPEDGDVMVYGDGGAGKTTLLVDLAVHLAAGDDWLGIEVVRSCRVLIIENEGPRPRFREKLRRKREAWAGSPLDDRLSVFERPWGAFTFSREDWRDALAEQVRDDELDVVICGPLTSAGMEAAGTLQDVRDFLGLVADLRRRCGRRLVVIFVHHENKGGKVSGAWEGAGDTLLHVQSQGHGRLRLHVQKARWDSERHGTTLQLVWADGDGFALDESAETTDDEIAEQIVVFIGENPGTGWTPVEAATKGVNASRRRAIRDGLLAAGRIVNVAKVDGIDVRSAEVPERRPAHLHPADDPTIAHLRPVPDADRTQTASFWGDDTSDHSASCVPPLKGDAVDADADHPPASGVLNDATNADAAQGPDAPTVASAEGEDER